MPLDVARSFVVLARSGMLGPYPPWRVARLPAVVLRGGISLGSLYDVHRVLRPDAIAVSDDSGNLSFAEMAARVDRASSGLVAGGVSSGETAAVLCRNHRDLLVALVALAKLGVDIVYLNTGFAAPQLAEVIEREGVTTIVVDSALAAVTNGLGPKVTVIVVDGVDDGASGEAHAPNEAPGLVVERPRRWSEVLAEGQGPPPGRPARAARQIVLTSGTTGTPKGARRSVGRDIDPVLALLSRVPLRTGDTTLVAAPVFHAWGLANAAFALALGSHLVLTERFDPEETLRLVEHHRATVLAAVPVMIQRIMALPPEVRGRYDTSSLRIVALSGSALPGQLALRFMDAFGDVIYNVYGSTEVGWASIASPSDLREAPGTAGRVPLGTRVEILDGDGRPVPSEVSGRIFVGSGLAFDGYTGGGSKEARSGMLSSGDVGHFDGSGRLFVDGRDDDMIVSGGENVFPREVEDLLADHADVAEVAVVGVEDDDFGQRLAAFVVLREEGTVDAATLQDYVRRHLARYKVPRDVVFVDELPRTTTGKVLTRDLIASRSAT